MDDQELARLYVGEMNLGVVHRVLWVVASAAICVWFTEPVLNPQKPSFTPLALVLPWVVLVLPRHLAALVSRPELWRMVTRPMLSAQAVVGAILGDTRGVGRLILVISVIAPIVVVLCSFLTVLTRQTAR